MSTISRSQGQFGAIIQREESERKSVLNTLQSSVEADLRQKGLNQTTKILNPQGAKVLHGYAYVFKAIEEPISTLMETVLTRIGITPNTFTAAEMLCKSDPIGLDPHEQLGIPYWKFKIVQEIHELMKELDFLERTGTLSKKIDRKKEVESDLRARLKELQ